MDAIDVRIALILAENGRMSNSQIARRLGLSEGTVRQRLRKLTAAGVLKVQALVNSRQAPHQYLAVIGLSIEGRQLEKCAEQIGRFPEVRQTLIVTGRYDILVSLLLDSHEGLVEFVTHKLSQIPGIRNSETFVCLRSSDPWLPATCLARPAAGTLGRSGPRRPARKRKDKP